MMSRNWKRHTESVYIFKTRTEALDWLQRRGKTYCVFSSAQGEKQQERGERKADVAQQHQEMTTAAQRGAAACQPLQKSW